MRFTIKAAKLLLLIAAVSTAVGWTRESTFYHTVGQTLFGSLLLITAALSNAFGRPRKIIYRIPIIAVLLLASFSVINTSLTILRESGFTFWEAEEQFANLQKYPGEITEDINKWIVDYEAGRSIVEDRSYGAFMIYEPEFGLPVLTRSANNIMFHLFGPKNIPLDPTIFTERRRIPTITNAFSHSRMFYNSEIERMEFENFKKLAMELNGGERSLSTREKLESEHFVSHIAMIRCYYREGRTPKIRVSSFYNLEANNLPIFDPLVRLCEDIEAGNHPPIPPRNSEEHRRYFSIH